MSEIDQLRILKNEQMVNLGNLAAICLISTDKINARLDVSQTNILQTILKIHNVSTSSRKCIIHI